MILIRKIQLALLTTAIVVKITAVQAATYNGDLIIGFTAESGNDLVYDLGSASSITNGQTWNLSSLLASFTLPTVKWGVVGANNPGVRTAYTTKNFGLPPNLNGNAAWSAVNSPIAGIYTLFPTGGAGQSVAPSSTLANSWNQQTIASSTPTTFKNAYTSPNVTGLVSNNFYRIVSDNSAPTLVGTFSLAASGVVKFNVVSLAPPSPVLAITRNGNDSLISFLSANNATYTLHFTNSSGLTTTLGSWPSLLGTIIGDGSTKTFTDTTTDLNRFYSVKAQ